MTARTMYDLYDLNTPFVTPTAPQAPTPAAPITATRTAPDRLLRGSAYLLTFAGLLLLAALVVASSPLGRIDADITVPFVVVVVGALGAIVVAAVWP